MALLEIKDLSVIYQSQRGTVRAVDGVSLDVEAVQHLGVIGESGCGKTTLIRALTRVLPRNGQIDGGQILFKGQDLLELSARQMRALRWREIATIPQASMDSLNPVQRVGSQLEEILTVRGDHGRRSARRRATDLFELVGLDVAALGRYPHEFSGGMKQRAVIAMALALEPSLLIADEPVTALDVIVQHQILEVLQRLEEELELTVLLITHDISVVAQVCDSVAVMYAGKIVEQCPAAPFFGSPFHPYSLGLQNAFPNLARPRDVLVSVEGYPPDLVAPPEGCRFAPRCPFVEPRCRQYEPPLEIVDVQHLSACLRSNEMEELRPQAANPALWLRELPQERTGYFDSGADGSEAAEILLDVQAVSKRYRVGGGMAGLFGRGAQTVHAVNQISFQMSKGESLGLAGESGCGKTTTGKMLVKLLDPSEGRITFAGHDLTGLNRDELLEFRSRVQLMFQNPFEALNPRFTIYRSLAEPLIIHGWRDDSKRLSRVRQILERVNLRPPDFFLDKYPHQLSGGQLQRVVLARSLILEPLFLVADEPVSMLDVSVRAGILNTMRDLAREMGLTTVYISHDLSLLQYTCDRIAIMYLGQIVELGSAKQIIADPQHPYTRALVSAVPIPDPSLRQPELEIGRGIPQATDLPDGCLFQDRCPAVMDICRTLDPPRVRVSGREVLCHLYEETTPVSLEMERAR